jgi:hypothetical protein
MANKTIATKSMARITVGPWKNHTLEILEQCQGEPYPLWNIKLPTGETGVFFRTEFVVVQVPAEPKEQK